MKFRTINLVSFSTLLLFLVLIPFLFGNKIASRQDAPWQLCPFNSGDSLSETYQNRYRVLDNAPLIRQIKDTLRPVVSILIDGWGVPYNEEMLVQDFSLLIGGKTQLALHKRLLGCTAHAETVELQQGFADGLYLARGDSAECAQIGMQPKFGMKQVSCCSRCTDRDNAKELDSILFDTTWKRVAWTARETNLGDRDKLHDLLRQLAGIASRHPDVQFIIQGTHRPILGTPEIRRKYNARWVPAVFINCELTSEKK